MKKTYVFSLVVLLCLLSACRPVTTDPIPSSDATNPIETVTIATDPTTIPTEQETTAPPEPVLNLTEEEKTMLLKLGMAERGSTKCTECIALIMRSVINRVEAGHFRTIRGAIFAQDQYLPVADGSFDSAQPNEQCYEALDMVIYGWDESQGALFYEWCEGESWHSKNLHLLFQHCDTRFYK